MERIIQRTEQNTISVRIKDNKYYEARTSLKIGGGKSERLQKGGKTQELAVLNLLNAIETIIDSIIGSGIITFKINQNLPNLLIKSINTLQITNAEVAEKTLHIVNKVNSFNSRFDNILTINNNIIPFPPSENNISNIVKVSAQPFNNYQKEMLDTVKETYTNDSTYKIEDIGVKWKDYEFDLSIKTEDNPKPLSQKTVDGHINKWNEIILPFFQKNKLLYVNQISEDIIKELIKSINYYDGKRLTYIALNEFFKYLKKQQIISINLMDNVDKPVKPPKDEENEIVCIEPENQNIYLDMFEEENTDMSLLFETMLLTGIRPEEACGLKWTALQIQYSQDGKKKYELVINNAYKDFIVYDEDKNPIGHIRRDDRLKTPDSYRTIPLDSKYAERLLQHKENQKQRFNKSIKLKRKGRKWTEKEYMFLGRRYEPYVADTLSSALPKLCDKYSIVRVSPYTLRHSFATFCFEKGMKELTLMKIMGHSSFQTTHKYYIRVSKKVKQREMEEVFKDVFYDRWADRKVS